MPEAIRMKLDSFEMRLVWKDLALVHFSPPHGPNSKSLGALDVDQAHNAAKVCDTS